MKESYIGGGGGGGGGCTACWLGEKGEVETMHFAKFWQKKIKIFQRPEKGGQNGGARNIEFFEKKKLHGGSYTIFCGHFSFPPAQILCSVMVVRYFYVNFQITLSGTVRLSFIPLLTAKGIFSVGLWHFVLIGPFFWGRTPPSKIFWITTHRGYWPSPVWLYAVLNLT